MSKLAWHFLNEGMKLGYGDGREVVVGKTLTVTGEIYLCSWGLHASVRLLDALKYAQKPLISRVKLSGKIIEGTDKLVATERKTLWVLDCERVLQEFAIKCAARALKNAKVTDERCWNAIKVAKLKLIGKATEQECQAANAAYASNAAYAANAAHAAAYAANAAASNAAYAAHAAAHAANAAAAAAAAAYASNAAAAAAANAAYAAANAAERVWQDKRLTKMIMKARKK